MHKKKQIVFVESCPVPISLKISIGLRKRGFKTVLVTLMQNTESKLLKLAYDEVISFDFKYFKINLKNLLNILAYATKKIPNILKALFKIRQLKYNSDIIIVRAIPNWLCFFALKYFKNKPVIFFPHDIRSFSYNNRKEALNSGISNFEIDAEEYCFENADGIIHKGVEKEISFLNKKVFGNEVLINCPIFHLLPLYLNKFAVLFKKIKSKVPKDKEIHLVYVGHLAVGKGWVECINKLTKQGIHIHVYGKTNLLSKQEDYNRFKTHYEKLSNNKFFHIHEQVEQTKIAEEIFKYDYAIFSFSEQEHFLFRVSTGNKLASYLEAGLPTICCKNYEYTADLIEKHGIGVTLKPSELKNLKKILEKNPPKKLYKNILKARKNLSLEVNIPDLEKFFDQVIRYHHTKNLIDNKKLKTQ